MTSLNDIQYFLAVTKTLNVSRAAELCGLSQPALSHALRRLEAELDTRLLIREKTGVQLTRAGQKFAAQSRELIEKWEALAKSIRSTDQLVSGDFSIGCHSSVAIYSLPHFLKGLMEEYADLHISLKHHLSREIAGEVIAWRIDFGIVVNPPAHPDLVIRELAKDEVTLWVSARDHADDVLIVEPHLLQSQALLRSLERKGIHFKRRIETTNLEVIRALVASGAGVGILPTRVAQGAQHAGILKKYRSDAPAVIDRICLIYRSESQRHASGKAIVDAISRAKL